MAESADRSNPIDSYGAIEKAYCADQWDEVIDQGQSLLQEISHSSAPVPEGLKERVQLLMAHAHLYGFNERDAAEDLYNAVLHSRAEVALRQIAEQGLLQCIEPQQGQAGALAADDGAVEASPGPAAEAPLAPTASQPRPDQELAEDGAAAERAEPLGAEPMRTGRLSKERLDAEPVVTPSQLEPAPSPASRPAPAAAATPTVTPSSEAATSTLAMPWLTGGAVGAAAGVAATARPSTAPTPWAPTPTVTPAVASKPDPQAPVLEPLEAVPQAPADEAIAPPEELATLDTTLIPEVVDEPELFEVHQADPALAEELDLTVLEPDLTIRPVAASGINGSESLRAAAEAAELDRVAETTEEAAPPHGHQVQPQGSDQAVVLEPAAQILSPSATESPDQLAMGRDDDVFELFRNPPTPVEEEDQELLLGMLRVLVSADSAGYSG